VVAHLEEQWSPEQIGGRLGLKGELRISHETIYRYVWLDKRQGGSLYRHLRGVQKKRRKRYGRYDSRGRLAGKRMISERPRGGENRSRVGHFEGETMIGSSDKHCVLTLVDRKTGYLTGCRSCDGRSLLLRDSPPLLGARHLREHQRPAASVPAQEEEHGRRLPGRLQPHRSQAQRPSPQTNRLPHSRGVL